jgi:hypothetical protein
MTQGEISKENSRIFIESSLSLGFIFSTPEQKKTLRPLLQPIAQKFRGKIAFIFIDW